MGVFIKEVLQEVKYYEHGQVNEILKYCYHHRPKAAILSSTAVMDSELIEGLKEIINFFLVLDEKTAIPMEYDYHTPETLGKDRLAGAVGTKKLFPGKKVLFISAGTCITFDYKDEMDIYQGGIISPGLTMRYKAMHLLTDKLPEVEIPYESEISLIGKSTEEALQSGGILGIITEIEGIKRLYKEKFGEFKVLITGGDANFLADRIKSKIFVVPNLIQTGLHTILQYNRIDEE